MVEPGAFQAFYDGPLQHPGLLWLAAAAGLALCLTRAGLPRATRRYGVALALLAAADAWLTSTEVLGIGRLAGAAASLVPLGFVLAGDLRFLLVVTSGRPDGSLAITPRTFVHAALLSVVVPISSQLVVMLLPDGISGGRTLFLVYEMSFALLALVLLRVHPNARALRWVRALAAFVIAYYVLWASADALILLVGDPGFLLRIVPNVLYYGGFIGVLGVFAAGAARSSGERAGPGPGAT